MKEEIKKYKGTRTVRLLDDTYYKVSQVCEKERRTLTHQLDLIIVLGLKEWKLKH